MSRENHIFLMISFRISHDRWESRSDSSRWWIKAYRFHPAAPAIVPAEYEKFLLKYLETLYALISYNNLHTHEHVTNLNKIFRNGNSFPPQELLRVVVEIEFEPRSWSWNVDVASRSAAAAYCLLTAAVCLSPRDLY